LEDCVVELVQEGEIRDYYVYYNYVDNNTNELINWIQYRPYVQLTMEKGQKIQFNGGENRLSTSEKDYLHFVIKPLSESLSSEIPLIALSGNINSLSGFSKTIESYSYYKLFYNCSQITIEEDDQTST
jgi:hypothetical protein